MHESNDLGFNQNKRGELTSHSGGQKFPAVVEVKREGSHNSAGGGQLNSLSFWLAGQKLDSPTTREKIAQIYKNNLDGLYFREPRSWASLPSAAERQP